MIKKLISYRVRKDSLQAVTDAIHQFVSSVREREPDTIYGAMQQSDGVSFVHAMAFPDEEAERAHRDAEHTREFVAVLYPACEIEPQVVDVTVLASTRKKPGGFLGT